LRRLGKVKRRRSPVRIWAVDGRPRVEVSGPDDLWTMDFKGWRRRALVEPSSAIAIDGSSTSTM
jgi:hypothetical protein